MDRIIMNNLGFYGYHGVLNEEKRLGQKFFLDVDIFTDLKLCGESDDVQDTINYAECYNVIKDIVENKRFNLIEALAENISKALFEEFKAIKELKIIIKKPEAPVRGIYDYFGVEIRRKRNE